MDKLPRETFIKIFWELDRTNKLQCILVCKKWHSIISNNVLYKAISIGERRFISNYFGNTNECLKAITMFKDKE